MTSLDLSQFPTVTLAGGQTIVVLTMPFIAADKETAARAVSLSPTTLDEATATGDLIAHYGGRAATKPLYTALELLAWVESLPAEKRGGKR